MKEIKIADKDTLDKIADNSESIIQNLEPIREFVDKDTLTTLISKVDTLTEKVNNLETSSANTNTLGSLIAIYTLLPTSTATASLKISGKCTITASGILTNMNTNANGWAVNEMNLSKLTIDGISGNVGHLYTTLTASVNNNIEIVFNSNSNYSVGTIYIYGNKNDINSITTSGGFSNWSAL